MRFATFENVPVITLETGQTFQRFDFTAPYPGRFPDVDHPAILADLEPGETITGVGFDYDAGDVALVKLRIE